MSIDFNNLPALGVLTLEKKSELSVALLQEQVIVQREKLHKWQNITGQPSQIDTGYIGQHLVSILTGIKGGGFRGKGDDLVDGSEVKAANFLDSKDARGKIAPRWNFPANSKESMEKLLNIPAIYLLSIDTPPWAEQATELLAPNPAPESEPKLDEEQIDPTEVEDATQREENAPFNVRFRVWKLLPGKHRIFVKRYKEWMKKLGKPKLAKAKRPAINFQLFPPMNQTNDTFARHGSGKRNGLPKLKIELDQSPYSELIYHAEIKDGEVSVVKITSQQPQADLSGCLPPE